jgi:peptidoglycan/xylan/chitin deacetylase (PgdA/CDA1 family)
MIPDGRSIEKLNEQPELWELFTTREEYDPAFVDMHDRFPYYLSNNRDPFEPKVSKYLMENGFNPQYPDGKRFAVCLTHDIDVIHQGYLGCAFSSVKSVIKGDVNSALKYPVYAVDKRRHPYWNFREIMKLEEKYGATSSFYFLALEPGDWDYRYNLQSIRDDIRYIDARGWEVGLHGGHEAYKDLHVLEKEKQSLEKVLGKQVMGYRNHFLHFKTPDTWELLSKAGFKYDTTFGYADCAGFRNGMCHPFKPFNLNTEREIDIIEIPLTIMDCTLLRDYMRLDIDGAWDLVKNMIDRVEELQGVITILWHNTYMQDEYLDFYEKILKYCYDKNAWMSSGKEICDWVDE